MFGAHWVLEAELALEVSSHPESAGGSTKSRRAGQGPNGLLPAGTFEVRRARTDEIEGWELQLH